MIRKCERTSSFIKNKSSVLWTSLNTTCMTMDAWLQYHILYFSSIFVVFVINCYSYIHTTIPVITIQKCYTSLILCDAMFKKTKQLLVLFLDESECYKLKFHVALESMYSYRTTSENAPSASQGLAKVLVDLENSSLLKICFV